MNPTFDDHLKKVSVILDRLHTMGMKVNLAKSEFFKTELDYLGYTLTPNGIRPQPQKVEAITCVLPPRNRRDLRRFLGMINYYRDMWKRRSHILAPLAKLSGKSKEKWEWGPTEQKAFEEAKRMVAQEAMLA